MRAPVVLAIAAVAAVVALRASQTADTGFPLSIVPQGVSAMTIDGTPVFVVRQGEVLTAFAHGAQHGTDAVVWCPAEQVFVSPAHYELFTIDGLRVDGPAERDMTRFRVRVTNGLQVFVDTKHPVVARTKSSAEISGEVGAQYTKARAGQAVGFCRTPVQ
jgi:nitrite reductase/ring-hydroxylating ferredoxin subunit